MGAWPSGTATYATTRVRVEFAEARAFALLHKYYELSTHVPRYRFSCKTGFPWLNAHHARALVRNSIRTCILYKCEHAMRILTIIYTISSSFSIVRYNSHNISYHSIFIGIFFFFYFHEILCFIWTRRFIISIYFWIIGKNSDNWKSKLSGPL